LTAKQDDSETVFDAITIGETMAAFVASGEGYMATAVGAESNVAAGMAQLGCRTRWISRVGDDELGRLVHDAVASWGVDVQVVWDAIHPTGVLLKEVGANGTRVRYYRSESAARHLCDADLLDSGIAEWVHVTGITAALSPSAVDLVAGIVDRRIRCANRISFDVNYRPALWKDAASAASVIVPMARRADVVFIGHDEADALLGTTDTAELSQQLLTDDDQEVILKRGEGDASVVSLSGVVSEPALSVNVVDLTGAGDAFAAGYLAARCWGWDASDRLRLGHFLAARVLGEVTDQGPSLAAHELVHLRSGSPPPAPSLSKSHR
jgi:2-dehydro-3-deoxygluconokinase